MTLANVPTPCASAASSRWKWLAVAALAIATAPAQAFEASVSQPAFTVVVPSLPALAVAAPAADSSSAPSVRLVGSDGTTTLAISVDDAKRSITPRECAGSFLRALVARPGMPPRDSIYRAPLNEAVFLVIYILGDEPASVLHAHLLSSAASTHCIEAHFTRALLAGEDEDAWRRTFSGASIVEGIR